MVEDGRGKVEGTFNSRRVCCWRRGKKRANEDEKGNTRWMRRLGITVCKDTTKQ